MKSLFWGFLISLCNYCVHGAAFRKKERQQTKKMLKKEIAKLAKDLQTSQDEFEIMDLFIFKRDLQSLYDDVTPSFTVAIPVQLPYDIQLNTIATSFTSLSFGAILTRQALLKQSDVNKVTFISLTEKFIEI